MHVMNIRSKVRDYRVSFEEQSDFIRGLGDLKNSHFVIDSSAWQLHAEGALRSAPRSRMTVFPISEERKCLAGVEELYDVLMERSAKKNMTLIAIGGGILQDITGFTATTLYRGINWIFVPTTLLAQADSCIGSKTSLNYKRFKNLLGTFYPPSEVIIHTPFLATLRNADFSSGLGEVVKLHLMGGTDATSSLVRSLPRIKQREPAALMTAVRASLDIKLRYMEGDEFDTGRRNLLNYGHCFGHALETSSDYSIPHGQAVVYGMLLANIVSKNRGLLDRRTMDDIANSLLLNTLASPVRQSDMDRNRILDAMKKDKKRTGEGLVMVLMQDGHQLIKVTDFTESQLTDALSELSDLLKIG